MSARTIIKVGQEVGRKLDRQVLIEIKYRFLLNMLRLTRVRTGALRGNTFVRPYARKRFNERRRVPNASQAAFAQRRYIRPYGRDIISQTAPYAQIWARKDALVPRTYNMTRPQIPAIIAGALR